MIGGFVWCYNQWTFSEGDRMKTLTLKVDDSVSDKFLWLLPHFAQNEVSFVDAGEFLSDDMYLRSVEGMVESIKRARTESASKCVALNQLDW